MTTTATHLPSIRITDVGRLYAVPPGPLAGGAMREIPVIENAELLLEDGRIRWFGPAAQRPAVESEIVISAAGGCVTPGLIDCHTHIPFAGSRAAEFVRRVGGESYLSIMQSGGGIRVTTAAVRAASEEQLVEENLPRLTRMLAHGVTTCECKSGYGLSPEAELKQLRAIRQLSRQQPIELAATYLGAHALPAEFEGRADAFIEAIASDDVFREIAHHRLAQFCDVFCDRGAFDAAQTRRVLSAAQRHGLRLKLHADELAQIGASRLAGELRAVSADHLEHIDDAGIAAMKDAGTIAVVLPGTSFFLGIAHADARRMIAAGLSVAIASDYNPGSCMIESLPLVMNIAVCQLRLRPIEVLAACTANAAAAIDRHARVGAIEREFDADLLLLDAESLEEWCYAVGRPRVRAVLKAGRMVYSAA